MTLEWSNGENFQILVAKAKDTVASVLFFCYCVGQGLIDPPFWWETTDSVIVETH